MLLTFFRTPRLVESTHTAESCKFPNYWISFYILRNAICLWLLFFRLRDSGQ